MAGSRHLRSQRGLVPAALALLFLCRGLLRGELFFERDQLLVFLPLKRHLAERLASFTFPSWWPWDGLGQPLAALPIASVFHPTTLAYWVLPFEWAFNLQTLVAFPMALLGAWYLARTLGLRTWGAAAAATLFACGFYFVALAEQTQMHLAAMSLPWVWRQAIVVFRTGRRGGVGLALAVANLMLGGDPMLLELAALSTVALVLGGAPRWRPRATLRVLAWSLVGFFLSAVQWVPMLHVMGESPRAAGLGIDTSDFWALRTVHLLGAVWPGSFAPQTFLFESTYVGVPSLVLMAVGLSRRWRWRWPLLGIAVTSLVLAAGRAAGLWTVFAAVVPGWQGFQFPAKAVSCAALAMALLAARGLVLALRALRDAKRAEWVGAVAVSLLAVELVANGPSFTTQPWSEVDAPPTVQALREAGVGLGKQSYVFAYQLPAYDTQLEGDRLQVAAVRPALGALYGLPSSVPYLQGYTRRYYDVALADRGAWLSRRAALFGTAAFVVRGKDVAPAQRARLLFEAPAADLAVLRASRTLPFAYVAFGLRRLPEAQVVDALGGQGFGFGSEVLVPADGDFAVPETFSQVAPRPIQPVEVQHLGDAVTLNVTVDQPGVLVINEAFTTSTRVTDSGNELVTFPVNHAALGVALPPGSHAVTVVHTTPGLGVGVFLSVFAVLAVLIRCRVTRSGNAH